METAEGQLVLEEEIDPNYEPTQDGEGSVDDADC